MLDPVEHGPQASDSEMYIVAVFLCSVFTSFLRRWELCTSIQVQRAAENGVNRVSRGSWCTTGPRNGGSGHMNRSACLTFGGHLGAREGFARLRSAGSVGPTDRTSRDLYRHANPALPWGGLPPCRVRVQRVCLGAGAKPLGPAEAGPGCEAALFTGAAE